MEFEEYELYAFNQIIVHQEKGVFGESIGRMAFFLSFKDGIYEFKSIDGENFEVKFGDIHKPKKIDKQMFLILKVFELINK